MRGALISRYASALAGSLALAVPLWADSNMPAAPLANVQLPNPAQEARARALMETLRCLVCQGQSIADSNAELAGDMRSLVRQRVAAGDSPEGIRSFLIARYGDWVSFAPPVDRTTWLLWAAPALLLMAGGALTAGRLRRRR